MWTLLAAMLAGIVAWLVISPFSYRSRGEEQSSGIVDRERLKVHDAKELAVRALKDLENDHAMGKVNQEDYNRSFAELSREAAAALAEMKRYEQG